MKPIGRDLDNLVSKTRTHVDDLLSLEAKMAMTTPAYTYEEAKARLMQSESSHMQMSGGTVLIFTGLVQRR